MFTFVIVVALNNCVKVGHQARTKNFSIGAITGCSTNKVQYFFYYTMYVHCAYSEN